MENEFCTYYEISETLDGFLLGFYNSDEGLIEFIDACSFDDSDKLREWCRDYDVSMPDGRDLEFSLIIL